MPKLYLFSLLEKSTIYLKHNSPIHTFQKLFPFAGSTQRSKGKKPKFPFFIQSNIWAYCDEIALDLIYSFNMWWQPTYLMSHSGAIKIHTCSTCITENGVLMSTDIDTNIQIQTYRYKLLYYKGYCDKSMGFPQKMTIKRHNICKVWIVITTTISTELSMQETHDQLCE